MKRLLAIILILAMALTVVACGSSGETETSQAQSTAQTGDETMEMTPQDIVLWHSMDGVAGETLEAAVDEFNATIGSEKQITVEAIFQGAYADSSTKLRTILQNDQVDQLPDLIQIDATGIVDYMNSEYAFTVEDAMVNDAEFNLDDIIAAPLKAWNYNDVQWGLPFSASTTIMYYNKTMLDEAGVTTAPTTFAEITAAAENLPATNEAGQAIVAYAQIPNTPTLANWIGQIPSSEYDASYVVDSRNGREASATKLVCDEEGTLLTFLTEWKAMYDAGALQNNSSSLSEMFLTEQLALYTGSTSTIVSLLEQIDGRFELGAAYLPRINDDSNYGATVSGSGMFVFNKNDDAKAMASWELLKYLVSPTVQANFATATGYTPVNKLSLEEQAYVDYTTEYPQMLIGLEQMNETSTDMMGVTVGPSRDFYLEIQTLVSNMLTNGDTPEKGVEDMSASLNDMLDQYARANQAE